MKKILIIYNDYYISEATLKFALELAQNAKGILVGLFVEGFNNNDSNYLPENTTSDFGTKPDVGLSQSAYKQTLIETFANRCLASGIEFKTHFINADFLNTLVNHSAFADVLVCDKESTPTQYTIDLLAVNAHCPVILVNQDYKQVDNIVFTYDDKSSSIYAAKYFTYLFSFFNHLQVHFVSVVPNNVLGIEYEDLINEWLPLHYPKAKIEILNGSPKEELSEYINRHSNAMVVMGAFGRSSISRIFKESFANSILKKTNAPIFITHD